MYCSRAAETARCATAVRSTLSSKATQCQSADICDAMIITNADIKNYSLSEVAAGMDRSSVTDGPDRAKAAGKHHSNCTDNDLTS